MSMEPVKLTADILPVGVLAARPFSSFDEATVAGCYNVMKHTDGPVGLNGVLLVFVSKARLVQVFITDTDRGDSAVYYRTRLNTWHAWRKIATTAI